MSWQRARNPEQKAKRRDAILSASARLLENTPMTDVSLNAIAREAGLAKSNLYRYFATREEIFLALLIGDIEAWAERNKARLDSLPDDPSPPDLAHVLVAAMIQDPRLIRLLGQLVSVLEQNASVEAIVDFKLHIQSLIAQQAVQLSQKISWLAPDAAVQLIYLLVTLLQGLWPSHKPSARVAQALQHPDLQQMNIPLDVALERGVTLALRGLAVEAGVDLQVPSIQIGAP